MKKKQINKEIAKKLIIIGAKPLSPDWGYMYITKGKPKHIINKKPQNE